MLSPYPLFTKYSLLTQFRSESGIRPTIALLISLAAISRNSVELASLYHAACGVQMRLGASFNGPAKALYGSFSWTSKAAALIRPSFKAEARAFSSTRPPRAVFTRNAP
ncbi:hypothetical protein X975_11971, partial [Stegodyphus mimosarum]